MNLNEDEESDKVLVSSHNNEIITSSGSVDEPSENRIGNESTTTIEDNNDEQVASFRSSWRIRNSISQSSTVFRKRDAATSKFNLMKKKLNDTARAKREVLKTYLANGNEVIPGESEVPITRNVGSSLVPENPPNFVGSNNNNNNEKTEFEIQKKETQDLSLPKDSNGTDDALANIPQPTNEDVHQSPSSSLVTSIANTSMVTNPVRVNETKPPANFEENGKIEKGTSSKREKIRSKIGKKFTSSLREKASLAGAHNVKGSNLSIPPMRKLENGEIEYRVKPFYTNKEPTYMTEENIYYDMLKPTKEFRLLKSSMGNMVNQDHSLPSELLIPISDIWKNHGDGRIGSLSIEILGAVGVRKFDRFSKPNIFANLICGDTQFETDVIHSSNSPMWPSKSKRGAVFPIFHAYVRLYLALFHEVKKEKKNDRFIGRTIIDVSSIRPNNIYDIWLPLKSSSFVYDRKPRGAVHVRFSIHWFHERSVVTSYLSSPQNQTFSNTLSIPCTDPKKFRNMVFTLHGEDLPGKYSPRAFQAVMREFGLYRVQLMYQCRHLVKDTMLYKRPLISFYLFITWMHCVYQNSVAYVPPYIIGFLILHLVRNYYLFCSNYSGESGYKPIHLSQIFNCLFYGCVESGKVCGKGKNPLVMPESVKKKKTWKDNINPNPQNEDEQGVDHSEFPFSEKQTYQRRTLEEYLASKSRTNEVQNKDDEDGEDDSPNEEDQVIYDPNESDYDSDYDVLGHSLKTIMPPVKPGQLFPVGPQQNVDMSLNKPVQVRKLLDSVKRSLHIVTGHIFEEEMYHFADLSQKLMNPQPSNDELKKAQNKYIKRLAIQNKSSNPIVAYSAQFLEPVMSIVKIYLSAVRLMFNVAIWKDPILTFWFLVFLIIQLVVLLIFPWRQFFFTVGIICLGPQNILARFIFHISDAETKNIKSDVNGNNQENTGNSRLNKARNIFSRSKLKFSRVRNKGHTEKTPLLNTSNDNSHPVMNSDNLSVELNKKAVTNCEVLVPYGRSRVDRFYYWPPDPKFSSSTLLSCEDIASMTDDDNFIFTSANDIVK